jgi:predicted transcriptional regulator
MVNRNVLMSIRPVYAEAIFAGTKTIELRRRRPSFPIGTRVVVYSTAPEQRLHGSFEVAGILEAQPEELWRTVHKRAGVDRSAFDIYFNGCDLAYGIEIAGPRRITPTVLPIRPPQSYQYLRAQRPKHRDILRLAALPRIATG